MKTATVFAAVAAVVAVATSVGLSAQAQNDPQNRPAPAAAPPAAAPPAAAPAPAPAPAPAAAPAPPKAAPAPAAGGAADAKLTKEETDQAEAVILDKCTRCHGTETITALHQGKAEWQAVLDDMGPSADLTKAEMPLVLRYLVENLGPPAKP